jgi:hypothetical protein
MHVKNTLLFLVLSSCLALYSCQKPPKVDVKTVDYYLTHDEERETVLSGCKNKGIRETSDTPEGRNCGAALNARQHKAHAEAVKGEFKKSEDIGWSVSGEKR